MDLDLLFWLLIAGIVLAYLSHEFPEPAEALSGIFGFREVLWPSGVQEDDDAHWSWTRALRERAAPAPAPEQLEQPIDRDPDHFGDGPGNPPEARGGRYEVRAPVRAQVRSAGRAKS